MVLQALLRSLNKPTSYSQAIRIHQQFLGCVDLCAVFISRKSTFFNVLTKSQAAAENFPFCTIDPNESRVPIPDERYDFLCQFHKPVRYGFSLFTYYSHFRLGISAKYVQATASIHYSDVRRYRHVFDIELPVLYDTHKDNCRFSCYQLFLSKRPQHLCVSGWLSYVIMSEVRPAYWFNVRES